MSNANRSWPVGIFVFYAIFMAILVAIVVYSTTNNVELVTQNYYEKTLVYEERIQAIKNTRALAKKPLFIIDKAKQSLFLIMPESDSLAIEGEILFFRPSANRLDFKVPLKVDLNNRQGFALEKMTQGKGDY